MADATRESSSVNRGRKHARTDSAREELARLHVRGLSNKAIAGRIGVVEETVCRWLKEPMVQKRIAELGTESLREARAILERAATESARTLVKVERGQGGRTSKERRLAAEAILDRIGLIKGERREHEHTVQGNVGAPAIAVAIERRRARQQKAAT